MGYGPLVQGMQEGVGHSPVAWIAGSDTERDRLPKKQENTSGFAVDFPDFSDLLTDPSIGRTDNNPDYILPQYWKSRAPIFFSWWFGL